MTVQVDQIIDIEKFTKEINEDINDLTASMRTQTARAAWYGVLHSKAKRQLGRIELTVKAVEAKLMTKHRKDMTDAAAEVADAEGGKPERITADMVKAAVILDPNMLSWAYTLLDAQEVEQICRVAYDAFRTRREMLTSLGHMTRAEMNAGMAANKTSTEHIDAYRKRRAARQQGGAADTTE